MNVLEIRNGSQKGLTFQLETQIFINQFIYQNQHKPNIKYANVYCYYKTFLLDEYQT